MPEELIKYILEKYKETEIEKIYSTRGEYTNTPFPNNGSGIRTGETIDCLKTGISRNDTVIVEEITDTGFKYGLADNVHRNVAMGVNDDWLMEIIDEYYETHPEFIKNVITDSIPKGWKVR